MSSWFNLTITNTTLADLTADLNELDGNLEKPEDVSINTVLTSLYFNLAAACALLVFYEVLRRMWPAVYSKQKKLSHMVTRAETREEEASLAAAIGEETPYRPPELLHASSLTHEGHEGHAAVNEQPLNSMPSIQEAVDSSKSSCSSRRRRQEEEEEEEEKKFTPLSHYRPNSSTFHPTHILHPSLTSLPDAQPLDWVAPVFGVPWVTVRKIAGLDGYFFLRYIRMCIRLTAVSSFWFFVILVPIYATAAGGKETQQSGWYRLSAANIVDKTSWRMWAPVIFSYLFTGFLFFVVQQEYRHFLCARQDFLATGVRHVTPQHHYSVQIEGIPQELRSDRALYEYFDNLFPGKIHSASVVLKVPDVEEASRRCWRVCRRLEKSIAAAQAGGTRPTHIVGNARCRVLGVDLAPFDSCGAGEIVPDGRHSNREDDDGDDDDDESTHSERNKPARGQRVDSIEYYTADLAAQSRALFRLQKKKEAIANSGNQSIRANYWLDKIMADVNKVAEQILDESEVDNDLYSSIRSPAVKRTGSNVVSEPYDFRKAESMTSRYGSISPAVVPPRSLSGPQRLLRDDNGNKNYDDDDDDDNNPAPFSRDLYRSSFRRWAGRLGLDFVVVIYKFLNRQLDVALEGVLTSTMSSTGFVTFNDLTATTCAANSRLSAKASVLNVNMAPEPREINWENCHVSEAYQHRREFIVNTILILGVIFWSLPLALIQSIFQAEKLATVFGFQWIDDVGEPWHGLIKGYLPVVAFLCLVMVLPVVFQYIATSIERRKTFSEIQSSMLTRYFYYQLANIYVTVTAGSLFDNLSNILTHPADILSLLGDSLPNMVGYFVALLVTKIMTGLPMVFLRAGALSRMMLLKLISNEKTLTQRELDAVYRFENVQYGWEFPTQLLVVVIVFTYAIICPIILPVGMIYFVGALIVYKKQILYVYSPVYESGGAMFPLAVQRTIFGLVCGQITFMGYLFTKDCYGLCLVLFPLPIISMLTMRYFHAKYVVPSKRLSLERARENDRRNQDLSFDKNAYRQPVLTEVATEPWTYRRGIEDAETMQVRARLRQINRYMSAVGTMSPRSGGRHLRSLSSLDSSSCSEMA